MATTQQLQQQAQNDRDAKASKKHSYVKKTKNDNDKINNNSKKGKIKVSGFAILRTKKLKTFANIKASSNHVHRVNNTPNANPELTANNRILVGSNDLENDVKAYLQANITAKNPDGTYKVRKDNVLCTEHVLTASPEFFKDGNTKKLRAWVNKNIEFLKEKHGSNLVHAVLHLDETTPHIHAYTVPILDGKLNQKHFTGTKAKMRQMQSDYALKMAPFGLQRGISGSRATHQSVQRFYAQIQPMPAPQITVTNSLKNILNPSAAFAAATVKLQQELETKTAQLNALKAQLNNAKKRAKVVNKIKENADKKHENAEKIVEHTKTQNNDLRAINSQLINEQAQISEQLALYKKYEAQIKQMEEQSRLQKEQELQQQRELEKQASHAEYYKNNKEERGLTR